jgi:hypothetical protein
MGRVAAKHRNPGAEFGTSEGNHMLPVWMRSRQTCTHKSNIQGLPNMAGHKLTVVSCSIQQDPLDQIVAILISRN